MGGGALEYVLPWHTVVLIWNNSTAIGALFWEFKEQNMKFYGLHFEKDDSIIFNVYTS